jgi:cation transport ATPase
LAKISETYEIPDQCRCIVCIKQNLFFAFIYNSAGVPIAVEVLYPFFGILLSPIIAAAP